MNDAETYQGLIPNNNQNQPQFKASIAALTRGFVEIQALSQTMLGKFIITRATGDQLDIIGEWVGLSRKLPVILEGVYFSWDDADLWKGWGNGVWRGPYDTDAGVLTMNDAMYRQVIQAKILANQWDSTITGAAPIWDMALPNGQEVVMTDNQDMTMTISVGNVPPLTPEEAAMVSSGLFNLKPAGVRSDVIYVAPAHF